MKKNIYIGVLLIVIVLTSCESYLEHYLGDQMSMEEVFSKRPTTERYLAQIYGFLPDDLDHISSTTARSDESYFSWLAYVDYLVFNDGSWNPTTSAYHKWRHYYTGINQATVFMNNVDQCKEITEAKRTVMKAEARFLRSYFYFMLFQQYGPVYIWGDVTPDIMIKAESIDRHSVDECVAFISDELTETAKILPETITDPAWAGRVTKGAALALKSRLLLYAARPLFNGCALYKGMKNYYGNFLFPQTSDDTKWTAAAEAAKAVINMNNYELYEDKAATDPLQKGIKSYMGIYFEKWNKELIFARYYGGDNAFWHNVRCSPSLVLRQGYAGYAPSLKLVDSYPMATSGRFPIEGYASDGAPLIDAASGYIEDGFTTSFVHPVDKKKIKAHNSCVGRDARFYSSILFSGMYWINDFGGNKLVTFHKGGTSGYGNATGDFCKVGYLFRRMCDPRNDTENQKWGNFSWPYIRLGEIYLNYAEACNEKPDRDEASSLLYLNKIRARSGLNKIEDAYPEVKGNKLLLRKLILKERFVEMAFENLRYYDIRTWMIAPQESNGQRYGRNLLAETYEESWERTAAICRPIVFENKHYFFPIHQDQLNEMRNITQNYGW